MLSALMIAASAGHSMVLKPLLAASTDNIINMQDKDGFSALHRGAFGGHHAVVQLLIGAGADPELRTTAGGTAAEYAEQKGFVEITSALAAPGPKCGELRGDLGPPPQVAGEGSKGGREESAEPGERDNSMVAGAKESVSKRPPVLDHLAQLLSKSKGITDDAPPGPADRIHQQAEKRNPNGASEAEVMAGQHDRQGQAAKAIFKLRTPHLNPNDPGSKISAVGVWLRSLRLSQCEAVLLELGYDQLDMIEESDDEEVLEMVAAVAAVSGIKKPVVKKFGRALAKLRQEAVGYRRRDLV